MASVNLQVIVVLNQGLLVSSTVQKVLEASHDDWLSADEMLVLFENRHLFPVSDFTVAVPRLYLFQTPRFIDDHEWVNFYNG
ncbi:hypothetical protein F2Q68_00028150 [Brassica cretica]|uniref:Uncharacterized protein n=1 Tax=Brassica cretica TaxID=69181 RepID=A0A8S9IDL3_BRACR|nr:hypothetical protein F2Q68_00028150 [Brassica cretica]